MPHTHTSATHTHVCHSHTHVADTHICHTRNPHIRSRKSNVYEAVCMNVCMCLHMCGVCVCVCVCVHVHVCMCVCMCVCVCVCRCKFCRETQNISKSVENLFCRLLLLGFPPRPPFPPTFSSLFTVFFPPLKTHTHTYTTHTYDVPHLYAQNIYSPQPIHQNTQLRRKIV